METLRYYLGMHPMGALAVVLSTVLLYSAFALFLSRVGQRMYASPSSLDLAVVTVLGAIVGRAILGQVPTLSGGCSHSPRSSSSSLSPDGSAGRSGSRLASATGRPR